MGNELLRQETSNRENKNVRALTPQEYEEKMRML